MQELFFLRACSNFSCLDKVARAIYFHAEIYPDGISQQTLQKGFQNACKTKNSFIILMLDDERVSLEPEDNENVHPLVHLCKFAIGQGGRQRRDSLLKLYLTNPRLPYLDISVAVCAIVFMIDLLNFRSSKAYKRCEQHR